MKHVLPISKRGTITLPPDFRKKMGIHSMENPLMIVEEEDGRLFMEIARAQPLRDIPRETLESWIKEDEAAGKILRKSAK